MFTYLRHCLIVNSIVGDTPANERWRFPSSK